MAYRLARPALQGFSSRPRGSKQATDRQSGGVLNIEKKLIAVGTLPRLAPRRSSITPAPPKKTKKKKTPHRVRQYQIREETKRYETER